MGDMLELKPLPKGYISVSQANCYRTCPERYYQRYIKGIKVKPGFAMVIGSSVHEALETNFVIKKDSESHEDLSQGEFIDCFETKLTANVNQSKEQFGGVEHKDDPGKVKDTMINSLQIYHRELLPELLPTEIEQSYDIKLDNNLTILVRIDFIDNEKIVDHKTGKSKEKLTQPTVQLVIYNLARPELKLRMDRLVRVDKDKKFHQTFTWDSTPKEVTDKALNDLIDITKGIRAGIRYKNPGFRSMNCNMCGFKEINLCSG